VNRGYQDRGYEQAGSMAADSPTARNYSPATKTVASEVEKMLDALAQV